jgi:hypothetical protein
LRLPVSGLKEDVVRRMSAHMVDYDYKQLQDLVEIAIIPPNLEMSPGSPRCCARPALSPGTTDYTFDGTDDRLAEWTSRWSAGRAVEAAGRPRG